MKIKTQETWLPVFTGYYHSIFDESDRFIECEAELSEDEFKEYYSVLYKAGVTKQWFDENLYDYIDYRAAENAVSEYICDSLTCLEHANIILDVEYEKTVNPKYYNFSTDSINCKIKYNETLLMKYLEENLDEFKKYIEQKYTSRGGFSSHYSNELEYWMDIKNHDDHEVGSLLNFVLFNEDPEAEMNLYYEANGSEAFSNNANIDFNKMIKDFNSKNKAV